MKTNLIITNILAVIGVYVVYTMSRLPEIRGGQGGVGPGYFPTMLGILMFLLATTQTVSIIMNERRKTKSIEETDDLKAVLKNSYRMIILLPTIVIYILLFKVVGFPILTFLIVFSMGWLLDSKHKRFKLLFSLGFTLGTWIIFKNLLGIPLPTGILSVFF